MAVVQFLFLPFLTLFWQTVGAKDTVKYGQPMDIMKFDTKLGEKLDSTYWQNKGVEFIKTRVSQLKKAGFAGLQNGKRARNIILFIGDGHGMSGITATRKYKESLTGKPFYTNQLEIDAFPFSGLSKTYELDSVIADSAGTATAYLTGVKTRMGFIGVDGNADLSCNTTKGSLESIAAWAHKAGKVSGLVTTTTITHASPSPLYAHLPAPLRPFEYYNTKFSFIQSHPSCEDIASQFVKKGKHLKVTLGGGRGYFTPDTEIPRGDQKFGKRTDGRNLIKEWQKARAGTGGKARAKYISSREELLNLNPKTTDYLLGLFHYDHMTFMDDRPPETEPSLTEMTRAAIRVLDEHDDGYFLFVEAGRIDHGHHNGVAKYALTEAIEFDKAIKAALEMVDLSETLIVVTADHSHTLSIGGYLGHENSILGLSVNLASDKKTYSALMYANGPGASLSGPNAPYTGSRRNESLANALASGYRQQAVAPLKMESHGGEDIPVYATGVYSELFSGTFEQSYIPWMMACAAGIYGPQATFTKMSAICPRPFSSGAQSPNTKTTFNYYSLIIATALAFSFALPVLKRR